MSPTRRPTLQSIILQLQQFWADQGCLIWQPYHTEVGAGTMNPATFLRVLGPEPWWVAYVEPSFRPADGRYGQNPNRWQHYYQFQVILKPDPGDPQERYLDSLLALGVDPAKHDIRFVEDNWEAPTLGAWGLGWEVWLDGQEITQYTYFQQAGGQMLSPVSVEITYGLERILQSLLDIDTFIDLPWDEHLTYGEVKLQPEIEYSTYNFEAAGIDRLHSLFEVYEHEAAQALDQGLVQPAHDYVLKCSHVFNLLDARGAVGVTERAAIFGRMRRLSGRIAETYQAQREEAGHPWLGRWTAPPLAQAPQPKKEMPSRPADFLFELGVEELPADHAWQAREQLQQTVPAMLEDHRLTHGDVTVHATPRRLVVHVADLAPAQEQAVTVAKGPPADRAFDESGAPTAAAEGFARSQGIAVEALQEQEVDGGRYVVAEVRQPGESATEVLAQALPELLERLTFPRGMRWNASEVAFSRPIRWMVALHGEQLVPVVFAGVAAGRESRGLRFVEPATREIRSADEFPTAWVERGIALDTTSRRTAILEAAETQAKQAGGQLVPDPGLLDEITMLVEQPTVFVGDIDPAYLALPRPVLLSVMRSHQRYFAVEKEGELLPHFIAVRNGGQQHLDTVRAGNEHVLRARLADATFFVERDRSQPLESYLDQLQSLTFEASLGSMQDKVGRLEDLVKTVAAMLELEEAQTDIAVRAAHLCKADLATQMVVEMTSLQGEMGGIYAGESGEPQAVSQAIAEHYRPRFAGDSLPQSPAGTALALADRLDSLVGLFAAGKQPSGAGDPFGLRRAAIGVVEILRAHSAAFNLQEALVAAGSLQPIDAGESVAADCLEFIRRRQQALLLAESHRYDTVDAVLAAQAADPAAAARAVAQLEDWIERDGWDTLLQNYARCARITRDLEQRLPFDPALLEAPAAVQLHQALGKAEAKPRQPGSVDEFMAVFQPLVPRIETFFEEVLVMDENEALRNNRLALMQSIVGLADGVLDFSRLEGF